MKKISYYLIFAVAVGGLLVSFWIYQRYFKEDAPNLLLFAVERGSIQENIKVRGGVVSQKDFDLEFPFSGIVERIFAEEGRQLNRGVPLMKLETINFELETKRLGTVLEQSQSNLNKLIAGPTKEELQVSETKVGSAKTSLEAAKRNLVDILQDTYTKSDDAIRNKVDRFFNNPRSANPQITFTIADFQLETGIEQGRSQVENTLLRWKSSLDELTTESDIDLYAREAEQNLSLTKSLLDLAALAVGGASPSVSITQADIDGWKVYISTGRTNINVATANLTAAEAKLKTALSALALAENELTLKKVGTRTEDIEIAKAKTKEIESQIAATNEKIKKSVLYAPATGKVTKVWLEIRELFRPGRTAVSLSASGYKIQADISELEIGKVATGNDVLILLDAFPGSKIKGKVVSVEPREIIKEGDKYYRTNIYMEPGDLNVRSGMSADLTILISLKDGVLKIPELAIYQEDGKQFVTILEGGLQKKVEIETGISDGESIEVIKGLSDEQTIAVSAD
ncbi:MAG: hypothetical protein BMS9Abin13_184 [Patescibacteria group bacterium]|nr:MAG: hypothetical protein BMS9Abin13_184 [Patescibacteria group bacterium]